MQRQNYDFVFGQAKSDGGNISAFLQLIWNSTTRFGVGKVTGISPRNPLQNVTYIVAVYDVPVSQDDPAQNNGNVAAQFGIHKKLIFVFSYLLFNIYYQT